MDFVDTGKGMESVTKNTKLQNLLECKNAYWSKAREWVELRNPNDIIQINKISRQLTKMYRFTSSSSSSANREFKIYDATAATTPQILHI